MTFSRGRETMPRLSNLLACGSACADRRISAEADPKICRSCCRLNWAPLGLLPSIAIRAPKSAGYAPQATSPPLQP